MARHGRKCNMCNGRANHVHHRTYRRIGNERPKDLVPLCKFCHGLVHAIVSSGEGSLSTVHKRLRKRANKNATGPSVTQIREALFSVALRGYKKAFAAITELGNRFPVNPPPARNQDILSWLAIDCAESIFPHLATYNKKAPDKPGATCLAGQALTCCAANQTPSTVVEDKPDHLQLASENKLRSQLCGLKVARTAGEHTTQTCQQEGVKTWVHGSSTAREAWKAALA